MKIVDRVTRYIKQLSRPWMFFANAFGAIVIALALYRLIAGPEGFIGALAVGFFLLSIATVITLLMRAWRIQEPWLVHLYARTHDESDPEHRAA